MPQGNGTGPAGQGAQTGRRGQGRSGGGGRGLGGGFRQGPGGNCICTKCNTEVSHVLGKPCNKRKCPACGAIMTRKI